METNDGHNALMKVAYLDLTTVWLHGISFWSPKMQQPPTPFLGGYKPEYMFSGEQLISSL